MIASRMPFPRKFERENIRARKTAMIKTTAVAIVAVLNDNHKGDQLIWKIIHHLLSYKDLMMKAMFIENILRFFGR